MRRIRRRVVGPGAGLLLLLGGGCGDKAPAPAPPTGASAPPPCVPALVGPPSGAGMPNGCFGTHTQSLEWGFEWSSCPSAAQYEIQVLDPAGATALSRADLKTTSFRQDLTSRATTQYQRGWRWKVRAQTDGAWGAWSPESTFDVAPRNVPYLVTPAENAMLDNGCRSGADLKTWRFGWTGCPSAPRYQLNIMGPTATLSAIDEVQTGDTTYEQTNNSWTAQLSGWRWRVRAAGAGGGWNEWSGESRFDVEASDTDCR